MPRYTVLLVALLPALAATAEPDAIGERDEAWWRAATASREQALEARVAEAAECEAREAPPAYGDVDGYVTRRRGDGRLRYVEVKRCDEERAALEAARAELERFEDEARRQGVPPGWLRE